MLKSIAIALLTKAVSASSNSIKANQNPLTTTIKAIYRYPLKLFATFLMAPYLAWCVARRASDPTRRRIAGIGLFISVLMGWFAGTLIGTLTGTLIVASHFGFFWGLSFLAGTTVSVILSVTFSAITLNATAYLFFHLSSEDIVEHLRQIAEPEQK